MPGSCIFCQMARAPHKVVHRIAESDLAFSVLDINPIRRGHCLVIPKAHATDLSDVTAEDFRALMTLVREVAARLRQRLGTTGENLLVASGPGSEQAVSHLHVHVIPRLPDDDLRWNDWWQTKVRHPEVGELEALARSLRA
jgi:histidine triad (HIT) family protein